MRGWTIGGYLGVAKYGCPKQPHDSEGAARAHIRSLKKAGTDWNDLGELEPYSCPKCLKWHVGHRRTKERYTEVECGSRDTKKSTDSRGPVGGGRGGSGHRPAQPVAAGKSSVVSL